MLQDHITPLKVLFGTDQSELRAQENVSCMAIVEDGKLIRNFYTTRSGVFGARI